MVAALFFFPGLALLFQREPIIALQQSFRYAPSGATAISPHGAHIFGLLAIAVALLVVWFYFRLRGQIRRDENAGSAIRSEATQPSNHAMPFRRPMNAKVPSNTRSKLLAVSGVIAGLIATTVYFTPTAAGILALPLSLLGFGLGVTAMLFRPRAIWLGALALLVSSPALAFVLVSLALGIRC